MKKLIEEHRKRFGDFEVIEFVDTERIEDAYRRIGVLFERRPRAAASA